MLSFRPVRDLPCLKGNRCITEGDCCSCPLTSTCTLKHTYTHKYTHYKHIFQDGKQKNILSNNASMGPMTFQGFRTKSFTLQSESTLQKGHPHHGRYTHRYQPTIRIKQYTHTKLLMDSLTDFWEVPFWRRLGVHRMPKELVKCFNT